MRSDDPRGADQRKADLQRFALLVREHYGPALRYAARLLGDASEGEDCVQEAFSEVFLHLASLRDPRAAPSWIRSIVRHRCARRSRRRDLELLPFGGLLDALPGASFAPDSEEGRHRRAFAQLLLQSLPAHERDIVVLFYLKDCSQREIASFLGLPLSTVNNRLHHARERMKQWERHMEKSRTEPTTLAEDRASRIGTVVSTGTLIEARFEPGTAFEVFDALAVVDGDGRCVERMKIAHRAGEGRVVCLPTSTDGPTLEVGTSVLNTGKLGTALTRLGGVRGVSTTDLHAAALTLRGASGEPTFLPTGIKALDLLCPLRARGVVAQAATGGVGRIVLLDELAQRLARGEAAVRCLCLVDRSEPDPYRGWNDWDDEVSWGRSGGIEYYWALSAQGTDPECTVLDACDAAIYMSPLLAVRGWYPAIDAEHSRSTLLRPEILGDEHCQTAARAREALVFLKRAYADPILLELLASRAFTAAQRRALAHAPSLQGEAALRLARARKLQLFLTQPFGVVTEWTGWPGVDVSLSDTLAGCRAILDGAVDTVPDAAFAYAGNLDDVRRHAQAGVHRRYG